MENGVKKLKRGERLFSEGDTVENLYIIKGGRGSVLIERNGKKIEVATVKSSQIVGDENLFSNNKQGYALEASSELQYVEIPKLALDKLLEKSPPVVKLLLKSYSDDLKGYRAELKKYRLENDSVPCSERVLPRVFSCLYLIAGQSGHRIEENPKAMEVDWTAVKLYSTRFFLESPTRVNNALLLLSKLGLAELSYEKNENDEDELSKIVLTDVQELEAFTEFFQYNLYKGGKSEIIFVDKVALKIANMLVLLSEGIEPDHRGASNLNYDVLLSEAKSKFNIDFKPLHINLLEKKGLFAGRKSISDKAYLSFDREEFRKVVLYWRILLEVQKWNDRGFVDLNDKDELKVEMPTQLRCPECQHEVTEEQKFCHNCGFSLQAA